MEIGNKLLRSEINGGYLMYVDAQTILTIGSIVTMIGALFGLTFKVHKWYLKQEQQTEDISNLRKQHTQDMKRINDEDALICYSLFACLDGLQQLGANHTVPVAKDKLDKYINQRAHEYNSD